jgi:hypothetical protein
VTLYEAARVSVLHASMMEYLLRLAHARYSLLAQWPDFTTMMGKDYYYRYAVVPVLVRLSCLEIPAIQPKRAGACR